MPHNDLINRLYTTASPHMTLLHDAADALKDADALDTLRTLENRAIHERALKAEATMATQAAEIARLRQECAELRGAMAADDERLRAAERRVWGGGLTYGCDGPEHLADEIERLRTALEAARAFVARLDECQPHIDNAFLLAHVHGSRYSGPNYADELKELRAALTSEGR